MNLLEIPGYKEALEKERSARGHAFLPIGREICGFPVRQMTLRDLRIRIQIGCPFVSRRAPDDKATIAGHVASFLWQIRAPDWNSSAPTLPHARPKLARLFLLIVGKHETEREVFARRIVKIQIEDAIKEINEYLDLMLLDAPSSRTGTIYAPKTDFAATIIRTIASTYHWSEEGILDMPLPRLYQHLREIVMMKNERAPIFNRLSDKVRGDYLRSQNEDKDVAARMTEEAARARIAAAAQK